MKLFLKPLLAVCLAICSGSAMAADYSQELNARWRGLLEFPQGVHLVLGINIENGNLTLDSPNQSMFGRVPSEFALSGNRVTFTDQELNASFSGELNEGVLKGKFTQGKSVKIDLQPLTAADRERLTFEGRYSGELLIDGATALPLQLNIAVLPTGYIGTLDSPAQHSYNIPLTEVDINAARVSFASPLIHASYRGEFKDGAYRGTFTQGMERPLSFKKTPLAEEAQVPSPKPQAGKHGGALAVITRANVETTYYADHDASTQYEIGSNTKTMVAYVLAQMLAEGRLNSDSQVADFWPDVSAQLRLVDLASHHSGLPRLPDNLSLTPETFADPYADYGQAELHAALQDLTPQGEEYQYSNFAYGILGEALARSASVSFAELLQHRVFAPLQMQDAFVALTARGDPGNLVQGYNVTDKPVSAWHFDALAGAGAVVATLPDMVKYLQAMLQLARDDSALLATMLNPASELGPCCMHPLGWILGEDAQGRAYAWHGGMTAGFTSVIGFYLDGSRAMVLLNNQSIPLGAEALAPMLTTP
ncbi:serine hydrolase domain-containing protein [Gilvimarinus chinensis]|uniref:serine hydrolase domain-containing protein n=1 Tax=Gilvimarinus chinensis TaxID=396005 RepID=UPI00037FD830|nr:serine hydrolase domain-containing protein [Gilvimarinus chinensis]